MSRVIIVGWDGATWDLLDRLMASEKLPNLKAFLGRAARGAMASTRPPVTAPAWVSIATGVNPGRHGCFDFNKPEDGLSTLRPLQTWDIAEKTFYEVLAERGRRTVLVNLPVSHPALTDQPTLTSLLTQGDNPVFPESLKEKYPVLAEYRCFPDTRLRAEGEAAAYLEDIRAVEAARFNCAKALWEEPWDVFFVVFSGTDWVSHEAFPDLMEGRYEKCSEALGMFEDADEYLGWILEQAGPDDHVLMVSDHGFCEAKGIFHLNEWLASEGYLTPDFHKTAFPPSHKMEEAARKAFEKQGRPMPPAILRLCYGNGLCRFAGKVYRRLFKRWPVSLGVDVARSRASTLTAECLGVTVHEAGRWPEGTVQPDQVAPLADEIRAKLSALRDPDGEPVFTAVQKREDVHHGPKLDEAGHVLLGPDRWGVAAAVRALPASPFAPLRTGIHSSTGIFAAAGPRIAPGRTVDGLTLLDVAPTVYYLLGEALPEGLDGALNPALFPDGALEKTPPAYAKVDPPTRTPRQLEAEEVQKRLKGLGYMG